jgi:hypothetical protein
MPSRKTRPSLYTLAITVLVSLQIATPAWAWGRLGHRVSSRLAEKQLTRAIHRACDQAKIERWSPNRLRHTAATSVQR